MRQFCASVFVLGLILSPTSSLAADGDALYTSECARCHGATGDGDTPAGKAMKVPSFKGAGLDAAAVAAKIKSSDRHKATVDKLSEDDLAAVSAAAAALSGS